MQIIRNATANNSFYFKLLRPFCQHQRESSKAVQEIFTLINEIPFSKAVPESFYAK